MLHKKRLQIIANQVDEIGIKKGSVLTPSNLYYLAFGIYFISYVIRYTDLNVYRLHIAVNYVCMLLLFIKFMTQHLNPRNLSVTAFCVVTGFLSWRITKDENLFLLIVFVVSGQDVEIQKLATIVFYSELFCITLISIFGGLGLIQSVHLYRDGIGLRTSVGFSSVNRFGLNFLCLCCAYLLMEWPNISWKSFGFCGVCSLIVKMVSDSRTSVLLILLLPFIALIMTAPKRRVAKRILIVVLICIIALSCLLSIYVAYNYDESYAPMLKLNELLTGRPAIIHYYYAHYSITLFGYNIELINGDLFGMQGVVMDNAYAKMLLVCGVLPTLVFLAMYLNVFMHSLRRGVIDSYLFGLFVYALVGLSEWQMYHFAMNYCIIAFSYCFFSNALLDQR